MLFIYFNSLQADTTHGKPNIDAEGQNGNQEIKAKRVAAFLIFLPKFYTATA